MQIVCSKWWPTRSSSALRLWRAGPVQPLPKQNLRHHAYVAAVAPIIPVSRPSCRRVPPGMRSIHPHKWHLCGWIEHIPRGTQQNGGLETGLGVAYGREITSRADRLLSPRCCVPCARAVACSLALCGIWPRYKATACMPDFFTHLRRTWPIPGHAKNRMCVNRGRAVCTALRTG